MGFEFPDNQTVTVEGCVEGCAAQNYTLAGLEFSGKSVTTRRCEFEAHWYKFNASARMI